ncbi:adenylosuccinate synthase [Candidatus Micrarchaeota archaeon]|nr:adenylosuccinate synthase [Candidatus Micrarchaeota archaeon]
MTVTVVVGTQWGDEAKGKLVDILAKDYDYVVRFNGGDNAGHTIKYGDQSFGLHLIPSGIFYPEKVKVIGNGVVINPETLMTEIKTVEDAGFSLDKLLISDSAHIILPWHKMLDAIEDEKNAIGTTKRGIGPTFSDKANRATAIRVCDLFNGKLREKLEKIAKLKEKALFAHGKDVNFNVDELATSLEQFSEKIKPFVTDTRFVLNKAIDKNILLEGAQGALLDVDHGTYPYVTSSNTTSGSASTGSGIPPNKITNIIGVTKAYTTRVGEGPFPTELMDEVGEKLRQQGHEFGTTTGRPRRCGWLDLVVLKYTSMINGLDELAITKLDVLTGFEEIKVCVAYEINGQTTEEFPSDITLLEQAKPVYKTFKGWNMSKEDWIKASETKQLPEEVKTYLNFIADQLNVKIKLISFGPERNETMLY